MSEHPSEDAKKEDPSIDEAAETSATAEPSEGPASDVPEDQKEPVDLKSPADELSAVLESTKKAEPKDEPAIRSVPLSEEEARDRVAIADGLVAERVELTPVNKPESVPAPEESTEDPNEETMDTEKDEKKVEETPVTASAAQEPRRDFLQKAGSVLVGGAITAVPAGIGIRVVAGPLFRDQVGGVSVRLTNLDSMEVGGPPRAFKVVADKTDAWTTYKNLPLGLVYAQRVSETKVTVFSASCPHAGCAVEYRKDGEVAKEKLGAHYYCPCHESAFALDGDIATDGSPAERPLDSLEVNEEKLNQGEVWVKFQRFKAGIAEKQAIS